MGRKQPRIAEQVDTRKRPRVLVPALAQTARPIWNFALFDSVAWKKEDGSYEDDLFLEGTKYLRDNSRRTWAEIEREASMNHWISVSRLPQEAKNRLVAIKLDDVDQLFSLRLSGTRRLWGLREDSTFFVVWWDPHHRVYPVEKKS